jgi:Response regulators consisting of a CheY-like receiver domain and a winged-helix DNA-binding domain
MRLEVEPKASGFSPLNGNAVTQNSQEKFAEYLNAGVKAAQAGDRKAARKNLMSALDIDSQSENAWLWLASISEYPEELLVFLNNVLDINPKNERALQWSASTKLLLSKTLVQRGIDAHESGRQDFAVQCFDQALSYDMHNVTAWLWLAALNDSEECRLEYFRRVLTIDPENETARTAVEAAESGTRNKLYVNAAWCASNGDAEGADDFLNKIFEHWPDDKDSWVLRSHLAVTFDDKQRVLERILELDSADTYARSNLDSMAVIVDAARSYSFESVFAKTEPEQPDTVSALGTRAWHDETVEPAPAEFAPIESFVPDHEIESIPTGDLDLNDVYFVDDHQSVEVLDSPTHQFGSDHDVETLNEQHGNVDATIYEPVEAASPVEYIEPASDPFSSVAEPIADMEPLVVDDRLRILVAESNPTARKLMAGKLENSGFNVICAETGREAVELAKSAMPAMVLADIAMPGMDGYAICRTLRDMELDHLPVVLISGKDGYYEEELGQAAGASGFITKPFGPETLMKTIENFLAAAPNH